ncbi:MAG: hypothetical protein L3J97_00570 [Thermoplasmata archaeon]|nr:hypothetical protein [Thermoplasmata archaeon]
MDEGELAWSFIQDQQNFIFTELATSLVGIGALFCAYGSLPPNSPIRLMIALIGFGGSSVLFLHSFSAIRTRAAAFRLMDRTEGGLRIHKFFDEVASWRWESSAKWFYVPVTYATTWFMGWVAIIWLFILGTSLTSALQLSRPFWIVVVLALCGVTYAAGLYKSAAVSTDIAGRKTTSGQQQTLDRLGQIVRSRRGDEDDDRFKD